MEKVKKTDKDIKPVQEPSVTFQKVPKMRKNRPKPRRTFPKPTCTVAHSFTNNWAGPCRSLVARSVRSNDNLPQNAANRIFLGEIPLNFIYNIANIAMGP
jgi:hypothetical protein